ncbi:trk system potassium uptake protein TrkH [Tepidamorphus gemmatus]|uniref:Trk system potassium uptake protein n=1 Tax=Tepidamorphus gemmatus TaxID=747076 RepID=A0A4R3MKH6_9HYPH|nr:TrkH family potassium uptake protein [Tepidamorphus gemmatus]TCT13208.1 trk system potassium uptake protein TrkH [Tepidamorphus gemmatus]
MLDFRPIFLVMGVFLATLGCAMLVPALVDIAHDNDDWIVFVAAGLITVFIGVTMWVTCRGADARLGLREAFVLTTSVWIVAAAFGALPFAWSRLDLSHADAFFEAMSGLTTTGSTVIVGLDHAPPGILFWRALLQWIGGLGIVVMAVAVLPMLQVGGMQLFRAEAFDTPDKILPRATQISGSLTGIYIALTAACAIAYGLAGMNLLDAIMHAMTTVATGGFSSKDASIGYFASPAIEWISVGFMIAGSLPFLLYVRAVQGHPLAMIRDEQVRAFFAILLTLAVLAWLSEGQQMDYPSATRFREALFNMTSIMTGTGYASVDYGLWGPLAAGLFLTATFIGGCSGSTSCGIKVFRVVVLFENIRQHARRITYPSGVFVKRYNGRPLTDNVSAAVLSFLFLFLACFVVLSVALSLIGLDTITAVSGAATAISNVGPGLGPIIGPAGTFAPLPDAAKWLLAAGMLVGRLEVFTVLILFVPAFWRR